MPLLLRSLPPILSTAPFGFPSLPAPTTLHTRSFSAYPNLDDAPDQSGPGHIRPKRHPVPSPVRSRRPGSPIRASPTPDDTPAQFGSLTLHPPTTPHTPSHRSGSHHTPPQRLASNNL